MSSGEKGSGACSSTSTVIALAHAATSNYCFRNMFLILQIIKECKKSIPTTIINLFFLQEKCADRPKCANIQEKLTACNDRVNSKSKTEETCLEELIDYVECVDHCVAETLFSKLK